MGLNLGCPQANLMSPRCTPVLRLLIKAVSYCDWLRGTTEPSELVLLTQWEVQLGRKLLLGICSYHASCTSEAKPPASKQQ